jgi:polyphosphate:AMP phosphotransferase
MFEAAELGREVPKPEYEAELPGLRAGLLQAQRELRQARVPLIVIVSGADGAGKSETVNRLREWLDPRGVETHVFGALSDEERDRPPFWRFWRTLPARGQIGIFLGSWYTDPIVQRVYRNIGRAELEQQLARIASFERELVEDGALLVKFWLHLSKKAQKRRLKRLQKKRATRWRVNPIDWKHLELYDRFRRVSEAALRATDTGDAPWVVVEAADDRGRELQVGETLLRAMQQRLQVRPAAARPEPAPERVVTLERSGRLLDSVDLAKTLDDKEYARRLPLLQERVARLTRRAWRKDVSSVLVFEGWDASGKGGAIRRLAEAMDARLSRVIPIAAPSDEERAHHYLWRFWRHIPRAGQVTVFDRSWYGRVLVERVEGFAREPEWRRAYLEINDFEAQLAEAGMVVLKFWIHVGKDEQLRRFEDRKQTPYKQHKITDEDWRNRGQWDAYAAAVDEMVTRTSTSSAPWTLVPGNDKKVARLLILKTFADRLEHALR